MSETVQYITNEKGDRIGIVLDLDTYSRLTRVRPLFDDPLLCKDSGFLKFRR
jgi:hypothetical protein